jgi:lipopolysaccharide transport system ATP-binding protein
MSVIRTAREPMHEPVVARPSNPDAALRVSGVSKTYRLGDKPGRYRTLRDTLAGLAGAPLRVLRGSRSAAPPERTIWALRDVSFEVARGEVVGIIGRNGAGKSTLLKILSRITEPSAGRAEMHGRVGSLLEVGTGFHPELTGRENVFLNGAILGMRRAEIASKFDEIVAFAEIEKFMDTAVKHYSSGMYMRLAFAVAAFLETEILLIDEVLAVGDVMFQKKCLGKMEDVARAGRTVLFVSHNMAAVRTLCTRGIVLHEGRLAETGDVGTCIEAYFRQIGAFQAEAAAAGDGPSGAGFGRVAVTGTGPSTVNHAEPFQVRTTLRPGREASGFSLILIVSDASDRMVVHAREESPALGIAAVRSGDVLDVSVRIPPLWLNPGLYTAHFKALLWGGFQGARHVSDKVPIDVTGSYSRAGALLDPPLEWTLRREDPA